MQAQAGAKSWTGRVGGGAQAIETGDWGGRDGVVSVSGLPVGWMTAAGSPLGSRLTVESWTPDHWTWVQVPALPPERLKSLEFV